MECAGRTDSAVSPSGAPRNVLGMKSKKVCAMDIETMVIANNRGINVSGMPN
jgi:hypothetical protein